MKRMILTPVIAAGILLAISGCGGNNNGPNPVLGGPDFNHPKAAATAIEKQIAGIQASGEPESFKRQQIAELQGLLSRAKPAGASVVMSPTK